MGEAGISHAQFRAMGKHTAAPDRSGAAVLSMQSEISAWERAGPCPSDST